MDVIFKRLIFHQDIQIFKWVHATSSDKWKVLVRDGKKLLPLRAFSHRVSVNHSIEYLDVDDLHLKALSIGCFNN